MYTVSPQVLWQVQLRHPFGKELKDKAFRILESHALRPAQHSQNFICASNTKERAEYTIDLANEKCGCKGGQNGILCSHLLALLLQQEELKQAKGDVISSGQSVLALREQQSRENRPPRGEWLEELDDTPPSWSTINEGDLP